jgi:hydrogenase maturation protease
MTRGILVAGIGNIFLGDDGFGVEVVKRLARRALPEGVWVVDFGIRGFDLACALLEGYDATILVDAIERGGPPGTIYVLEVEADQAAREPVEAHGMHPAQVLRLVRAMGGEPRRLRLVGCEPEMFGSEEAPVMGLSPAVESAVDEAVGVIESLLGELLYQPKK